ncbi:NADH:flavorubredoxin reductase NorW [Phytobacter sp. V91]|uniref:NADH:flavorubredoxin reductase NorW n=1 Tax=Phytobacter sp. V91 TaxID=3369425 RepID=UPI003F637445
MNPGIVIVGSGFAARQLVKNIRKLDAVIPLTLIARDSMDEYNKPDLSHVLSLGQRASHLTRQSAGEFAEQFNLRLFPHTCVTSVDAQAKRVNSADNSWQYDKLVLATGARAFVPQVAGSELMLTLNSQQEYQACETQLRDANRVLIVGGGLIGTELAMDFRRAGKQVTLVDNAASILSSLMPPEVSSRLQHCLSEMGVRVLLNARLSGLNQTASAINASFDDGLTLEVDAVVAATGLVPETALAQSADIRINRGILVDSSLQTSQPDIYALGDGAEINGQLLPFLQPIQLCAMYLAKQLLGVSASLSLPAMLVKVKTPALPLHLAGESARRDLNWHITTDEQGMVAKGLDNQQILRAFVVSEDHMKTAFALLKTLSAAAPPQ